MTIFHPIPDFLYELVPAAKGKGTEALVRAIRAFYVQGGFAPEVVEANGIIEVRSVEDAPLTSSRPYQQAVGLCEKGQDALKHFKGMPPPKIKEVSLEIAMLGTQSIHPEKQGYHLHHVPGKTFSGHHLLAYYYVSWELAVPEMAEQLQLPYDGEYGMAVQLNSARL